MRTVSFCECRRVSDESVRRRGIDAGKGRIFPASDLRRQMSKLQNGGTAFIVMSSDPWIRRTIEKRKWKYKNFEVDFYDGAAKVSMIR